MDIDIDLPSTFDPHKHFDCVTTASRVDKGKLVKHNCGVYFQKVPTDPITGLSAIPFKKADEFGLMKIDFLHLHVMDYFENKAQIRVLLKKPPKWGLLLKSNVVEKLFQLSNHGDILRRIQPKSILELADCIAIIRPAKSHLLEDYINDPEGTRAELYRKETKGYAYKKGHAIAYAMNVVLQLHLIDAEIL